MKVTGFSFIRNAEKYDYPIREALLSILPLCDEVVVAVGNSEDGTRELVASIAPDKIRILDTVWNEELIAAGGGKVLADETNKAFQAIAADSDWAIYIQGDEAIHEQYHQVIQAAMRQYLDHPEVEGLLFQYLHFWGSYQYVGTSRKWYRREVRIIRNNKDITSYLDAQGFRWKDGRKLNVKPVDAYVYHYGYVRHPAVQVKRTSEFALLWHNQEWVDQNCQQTPEYDYHKEIDALAHFTGTHPASMAERICRLNWKFEYDTNRNNTSLKNRLLQWIAKNTGWYIGEFKNFKVI
jgi:glycosyltransferase involved in cell wall biosynthesis